MKLAQGILCGSWALAFPFDWARLIVDNFELSPLPRSPNWLLGAANVDGSILPVIDLTAYLTGQSPSASRQQRLLIGGLSTEQSSADTTGDAIAIAFEGLPQQLSYERRELSYAGALPLRLRELCIGVGSNDSGQEFLEIDTQRLFLAFSDELAQT